MTIIAIYAPMIYTAPCIMFWMRAYPLLGQVEGGFLGPKWHSPIGSMSFHRAQKTLDFQGPKGIGEDRGRGNKECR